MTDDGGIYGIPRFHLGRADGEVTDPALYDEICGQAENHKSHTKKTGKVLTSLWEARVWFYSHFTRRLAHEGWRAFFRHYAILVGNMTYFYTSPAIKRMQKDIWNG